MSIAQRIIKNSLVLSLSQILSKFINIGLIIILTRILGKDGFGLYSFSFAYVSLFAFFISLGLSSLIAREIAKNKDKANTLISNTFPFILISAAMILIIMNTIAFALQWEEIERTVILIFGFYLVFDTFGRYFLAVTRAFEQMEYEAVINFSERVLLLIMALVCWLLDYSLIPLVILFSIVEVLKATTAVYIVRKYFTGFQLNWRSEQIKDFLLEAYPFALIGIFLTISMRIDLILLKHFYSADIVGVYSAARKLIESLSFIPENIYNAVFPALSILFVSQKEKYNLTFQRTFMALTLIALPISISLYVLAPRIIQILFTSEFSDAAIALKWLAIALLIIYIRFAFAVALSAIGKQMIFAVIVFISMCVSISMNYFLIPILGIAGASISVILYEATIIICSTPVLMKTVKMGWIKIFGLKVFVLATATYIMLYLIKDWNIILVALITGTVYIGFLFLVRLTTPHEIYEYYQSFVKKYLTKSKN